MQPAFDLSAEMTAAGITGADQSIAKALLLTETGWIAPGKSYGVYKAAQLVDPTQRFERVNRWVLSQYGSWTQAQSWASANGGNW